MANNTTVKTCQYVYQFFWPDISAQGFVNVQKSGVAVHFPEKSLSTHDETARVSRAHTTVLTINQHVLFHTDWLPIWDIPDEIKCHDMLRRLHREYLKLYNNYPVTQLNKSDTKYVDEVRTVLNNATCSLECTEEYHRTTINLQIKKNSPSTNINNFPYVEIYFGSSLKFSSTRDLEHIDNTTFIYILDFIMQKIIKM